MSKARNIADLGTDDVISTSASGISVTGTVTATDFSGDGSALTGVVSAYNEWSVKTTTYTAASKDQLACNGTFTVTLPATPSAADTVTICNVGAGTITIARNGSNINSLAEDGTLNAGNSSQLVYIDGTIGWKEI
jgi:hypothetical protein